jgi:hypothetical protein
MEELLKHFKRVVDVLVRRIITWEDKRDYVMGSLDDMDLYISKREYAGVSLSSLSKKWHIDYTIPSLFELLKFVEGSVIDVTASSEANPSQAEMVGSKRGGAAGAERGAARKQKTLINRDEKDEEVILNIKDKLLKLYSWETDLGETIKSQSKLTGVKFQFLQEDDLSSSADLSVEQSGAMQGRS